MTEFKLQDHVASDVLAALLGLLPVNQFTGDMEKIHTTLARAKRHYPVLNVFSFTAGDVYPFSRDLEDSFSILQRSKMISVGNPEYVTIAITPGGRKVADTVLSEFDADEQRQLRELAEIFRQECSKFEDRSDPAEGEAE